MSELLDAIRHNRKMLMLILGGIFIIASLEHIESVLFYTLGVAIIAVDIIIETNSRNKKKPMMGDRSLNLSREEISKLTGVDLNNEKSEVKINTTKEVKEEALDRWKGGTIEANIVSTKDFGVDVINNYEDEDVRNDFAREFGVDPKNVYTFHFKWAIGQNFLGWCERGLTVGVVPTTLDYSNYSSSLVYKNSLVKCSEESYKCNKFKYADVYKLFYYKDCVLFVVNDDLADHYQVVKFSIE